MIVVSDSSVITSLIQIGRAGLLKELYQTVLIPSAVHAELLQTHTQPPAFLEIKQAVNRAMVARLEAELDLGGSRSHRAGQGVECRPVVD